MLLYSVVMSCSSNQTINGKLKLEVEIVRVGALLRCLGKATLHANDDFERLKQMGHGQQAVCKCIHCSYCGDCQNRTSATQDWD